MLRVASAVLGAISFQLVQFAMEVPQGQAAWGWYVDAPVGSGFACEEGNSIGGASGASVTDFDCTVVPDDGMECDVSSTSVVCYKTATPDTTFVPTQGVCLNFGHTPDADDNDNDSAIKWSTVPTCTDVADDDTTMPDDNTDVANGAPMASAVGAAFLASLICV